MPTDECRVTIGEIIVACLQTAGDKANALVATAAMASPLWLPSLKSASAVAADLMPIVGLCWLGVQIYAKVGDIRARRRADHEKSGD